MHRTAGIGLAAVAALAATGGGTALAAAPHAGSRTRTFSEYETGTQLSATGLRFEDVYRIKRSPFGGGSVIRDATLTGTTFPVSGKATATSYYKDGRQLSNETFTYGAPRVDGVGGVTGTGTCSGGSEAHQGETCTYKIRGTYDLVTGQVFLTLTGTYTPSSATKKK